MARRAPGLDRSAGAFLRRRFVVLFAAGLGFVLLVVLLPQYANLGNARLAIFLVGLVLIALGGAGGSLRMRRRR